MTGFDILKANPLHDWTRDEVVALHARTSCPVNVLARTGLSARSAARRARAPSRPASPSAPGAGGGNRRARKNAACMSGPTAGCNARRQRTARMIQLTHLQKLEAEAIHIIREVAATARTRSCSIRSARIWPSCCISSWKAFCARPSRPSRCSTSTRRGISRDDRLPRRALAELGLELIVHINEEGRAAGVNPFDLGLAPAYRCDEDAGAEPGAGQV